MTLPDRVTASWIATLGNPQLVEAESHLHGEFAAEENHEKRRRGDRYVLLQGPEPLVTAWHRWLMVNNEMRLRGLVIRHRK
jgi:hypothetical protein